MSKKSVFIFEFISGGGFSKFTIPSSLFCEGFGMLKSIIGTKTISAQRADINF